MGQTMENHRRGDARGNIERLGPGNARVRRGTKNPPRTKKRGRKATGGKVIPLVGRRRTGGTKRGAAMTSRPSNGTARANVGHRRLWMVAAIFVMTGLLLGARAVHISLTEGQNYRAFADEQVAGQTPFTAPTRGSIRSADGRELATSLEVARVI